MIVGTFVGAIGLVLGFLAQFYVSVNACMVCTDELTVREVVGA